MKLMAKNQKIYWIILLKVISLKLLIYVDLEYPKYLHIIIAMKNTEINLIIKNC